MKKIVLTLIILFLPLFANDALKNHPKKPLINGKVNGYIVGTYPAPYKGLASYSAPKMFLELKDAKSDLQVSPHFRLKSFLCKQASPYPKYLLLKPSLVDLLEKIIARLNEEGHKIERVTVMSGYRTPYYNRRIGSSKHSRHMYGDAADIYIDQNNDGYLDDLNRDGKIDDKDTEYLANIAIAVQKKYNIKGGVGKYRRNAHHPRFVHVDTRGFNARW